MNSGEILKQKVRNLMTKPKALTNGHIPDLIQAFYYVANGGFTLVLSLAKPLTYMIVV